MTDYFKNTQIKNFVKIRPVEAELFHADGQTDVQMGEETVMLTLIVAFRNFADAPKIDRIISKPFQPAKVGAAILTEVYVPLECCITTDYY